MVEKQDFEILLIGQKVHLRLLINGTPMSTIQNLPHTFDYKIGTPENNKLNKQNEWEEVKKQEEHQLKHVLFILI